MFQLSTLKSEEPQVNESKAENVQETNEDVQNETPQAASAAQAQETETSDNVQQTNEVSNVNQAANNAVNATATSSNERKVITTDVPPVIEGNAVTFGNGRTVKLVNGETVKLSDDGKSVIVTRQRENRQDLSDTYALTRTTYDINGNEVEIISVSTVGKNGLSAQGLLEYDEPYIKREFDEYGNITVEYSGNIATIRTSDFKNGASVKPNIYFMKEYEYDESGRVSGTKKYLAQYVKGTEKYYPKEYQHIKCIPGDKKWYPV